MGKLLSLIHNLNLNQILGKTQQLTPSRILFTLGSEPFERKFIAGGHVGDEIIAEILFGGKESFEAAKFDVFSISSMNVSEVLVS